MTRPPILSQSKPFAQLTVLMALWVILLLISMAFSKVVGKLIWGVDVLSLAGSPDFSDPLHLRGLRFLQVVNQLATLVLPPVLLSLLISKKPWRWLGFRKSVPFTVLVSATLLMLVALPLIDLMGQWNMAMRLPGSLSALSDWMLRSEEMATRLTDAFMGQTGAWYLFYNLMMVGVLAALGEELLFRVALIRLLTPMFRFRNEGLAIHFAVVVSAFLFAALHMQFFTFLPRFMLGLLLGYLYVWSGSLWLPFLAHFVNNAFAVLAYWAWHKGVSGFDPETIGGDYPLWVYLLSFLGVVLMVVYIFFRSKHSKDPGWRGVLIRGTERPPEDGS